VKFNGYIALYKSQSTQYLFVLWKKKIRLNMLISDVYLGAVVRSALER